MNVCEALGPPGSSGELGPKDPYWLAHLTNPPYPKEGGGEGERLVTRWSDALAWQDSGWNISELVTPPSLACCEKRNILFSYKFKTIIDHIFSYK